MNELKNVNEASSLSLISNAMQGGEQGLAKSMQSITSFQAIAQKQLVKDIDFGTISGTQKPTLLKPGAEKLLMILGLRSIYDVVDKVENFDQGFFAYTVKAKLFHGDDLITEGLGAANTKESRYRQNEYDSNRHKKPWDGVSYQDPYTLQNTVLKMAKKRAQVDAALTVGSLSNVFTQDLEDMRDFSNRESSETMTTKDAQSFIFKTGKHKGQTIQQVIDNGDGEYIDWMSKNSHNAEIKKAISLFQQNGASQKPQQTHTAQNTPSSASNSATTNNTRPASYAPNSTNYGGNGYGSAPAAPAENNYNQRNQQPPTPPAPTDDDLPF